MSEIIRLQIGTEGDERIVRDFVNRWNRANNLRQPLANFAKYYRQEIDSNFGSRGGGMSPKWKARRRKYSHPLLEKTGAMRRGFTQKIGAFEVEFANSRKYFKFHQLGTSVMPARKMWGVRNQDGTRLIKEIQKYLVEESK